jgi:transketolase
MASGLDDIPAFAQWRKIKEPVGERKAVVIGTGSVTDQLFKLPAELINDLEIWLLSTYPVYDLPGELLESISDSKNLITLEEHRGQCGMHEAIASLLLKKLHTPIDYHTLYANGYPSGRYGSQQWHLEENSLAGKNLVKSIQEFLSHSIHVVG